MKQLRAKVKLIEYWELRKWYYKVGAFLLVAFGGLILLWPYIGTMSQVYGDKLNNSGFIGILGSLLGAIVGGLLSMAGTKQVQRKQAESKAAIIRKNIIYTPLYDELIQVREVLTVNPYPHFFEFDLGSQTIMPHPQFSAWKRIKNDTRGLQVPGYIADSLDEFITTINKYLEYRKIASNEVQGKN